MDAKFDLKFHEIILGQKASFYALNSNKYIVTV